VNKVFGYIIAPILVLVAVFKIFFSRSDSNIGIEETKKKDDDLKKDIDELKEKLNEPVDENWHRRKND
jgi:hypothetical protein